MNKKKQKKISSTIVLNKKARHDYFISDRFEAGLTLQGWEVKSMREGRVQIKESYVIIKDHEIWLYGSHVSPLKTASTHTFPDPVRARKLLLHKKEISRLVGSVERKGFTLVPLCLYWKRNKVKIEIALAKGKKLHDKRASEKAKDWDREKHRVLKNL